MSVNASGKSRTIPPLSNEKLLYSIAESATILSVSEPTIHRRVADGTLPTIRIGRRRLVSRSTLEAIAAGRNPAVEHAEAAR